MSIFTHDLDKLYKLIAQLTKQNSREEVIRNTQVENGLIVKVNGDKTYNVRLTTSNQAIKNTKALDDKQYSLNQGVLVGFPRGNKNLAIIIGKSDVTFPELEKINLNPVDSNWHTLGRNNQRTNYFGKSLTLTGTHDWTNYTGSGHDFCPSYKTETPVIAGNTIVFVNDNYELIAYSLNRNQKLWHKTNRAYTSPSYYDGKLYCLATAYTYQRFVWLVEIDVKNGKLLRELVLPDFYWLEAYEYPNLVPIVTEKFIFIFGRSALQNGIVLKINRETFKKAKKPVNWNNPFPFSVENIPGVQYQDAQLSLNMTYISRTPAYDPLRNRLYTCLPYPNNASPFTLSAYSGEDLSLLWSVGDLGLMPEFQFRAQVLYSNNKIFTRLYGHIYCYSSSGSLLWIYNEPFWVSIASPFLSFCNPDRLLFCEDYYDGDGGIQVKCLNANNGIEIWRSDRILGNMLSFNSATAIIKNYVLVATYNRDSWGNGHSDCPAVTCLNLADGSFLWRYYPPNDNGNESFTSPISNGKRIVWATGESLAVIK